MSKYSAHAIIQAMDANTPLVKIFRLNPIHQAGLARLKIATAGDLLLYFPNRYEEPGARRNIADLALGENAIIYGKVTGIKIKKTFRTKIPMSEATIEDQSGKIKAVWYHQAYMAKKSPEGAWAEFRGKVTDRDGELYLANPEVRTGGKWIGEHNTIFADEESGKLGHSPSLIPVYPETRGLSSGWFYYHIERVLRQIDLSKLVDPIPAEILTKYHLPSLATALVFLHLPQKSADAEVARKRFAFQEVLMIQLARLRQKKNYQAHNSFKFSAPAEDIKDFLKRFPFEPTSAQHKAIGEILTDLNGHKPMLRLLEGDVGSGKTLVAAVTAFAAVKSGLEVAYMAPTEILARQHFESFISYFKHIPNIQVGLITGTECRKFPSKIDPQGHTHISRTTLLKWVANGEIPILIGTHALIQKSVKFKNLAYAIIDEQHRFGVIQRGKLVRKDSDRVPHLLSMTATPIPRTLALTIYGDLDLSLLDAMPAGRKPIITEIVAPDRRDATYEKIRKELQAGRQAYIICPRIDEPDPDKELALQAKSAKSEQVRLGKKVFPEYVVGLVHSKMKPKDKEEVMAEFTRGEINILVATSVVEVGVNVPNATVIVIEGSERFGLAQLHQLRGRVLRSSTQAYCYLFSETKNAKSMERLKALKTAKNGFELAEMDLALRGSGTLTNGKQWGITDIGMEAIKNLKMVEAARTEAQNLLEKDFELKKYPLLREKVEKPSADIHFE